MKIIDKQLLDKTSEQAKQSPRLRMNYNFHERLDDPVNRLLNAMEPDTYIRPHRHLNPDKDEIFLLLRGKAVVFIFDDQGGSICVGISPFAGVLRYPSACCAVADTPLRRHRNSCPSGGSCGLQGDRHQGSPL